MKPVFGIEALTREHVRAGFDCGDAGLNQFLFKFARQNSEKGLGRTFVAVPSENKAIAGYYTISSGSISFEILPAKLPRYPIPTAHLGRLATDMKMRGQGLGEMLLIDALQRTVSVSAELGIYAVELFALTEKAKSFYLKYGFVPLEDDARHLYLPIETLKKSGLL